MPEAPLDASFGRQADVALAGECAAATSLSLPAGSRPAPSAARLGRTWPPARVELQSWIELAPVAPHRRRWPDIWASARSVCGGWRDGVDERPRRASHPCEPQKLCADCVALGILSLLAGMAVDDGDSRGQWRLSRNPCSPHASWRERRRLGHGHGFGQFSGRALGVANSRPIQGRTSSDLQTATLYSWCSPPRMGTARTLLAGVGRIGGNQCAPNGACMCSPR